MAGQSKARLVWALAGVFIALSASSALADDAPTGSKTKDAASLIAAWIQGREANIEDEIVALVQKRPDPPATEPLLEFQIDIRVIERELLDRALGAKDAPEQAELVLQQIHLAAAATDLDDFLARTPLTPTDAESAALKELHDKTFHLDQVSGESQADELCAQVGMTLLNLAGPVDKASVPRMRPAVTENAVAEKNESDAHVPTLQECAQEARSATVPAALHKQLLALAAAAQSPAPDDGDPKALQQTLLDSVILLRGLKDLPVAADSRDHIESMLASGITLLMDVRTRSAGEARLKALAPFRDTVKRIGHLALPPDVASALAPALAWAAQNAQDGPAVLAAIARYLENIARHDAMPAIDTTTGQPLDKPLGDLQIAFATAREAFINDAQNVNTPAGARSTSASDSPAQQLSDDDDAMAKALDAEEIILKIPAAVDAIESVRVHGTNISHRAAAAATELASTNKLLNTADALRYLQDVVRLGDVAGNLKALHPKELPPTIVEGYTAGAVMKFETRWRYLMSDQSNLLAAGMPLDDAKMGKLDVAVQLAESLEQAAGAQTAASNAAVLSRWVDWTITGPEIQAVLEPYRTETAKAFAADDSDALDEWMKMRTQYKPVLRVFAEASGYAQACSALPTGLQGDAADLVTPLAHQPFGAERRASVELAVWAKLMSESDSDGAGAVMEDLAKGLKR